MAEAIEGNLEAALADLNLADQMRPGDFATLQARGIVYARMEKDQQALQDLSSHADAADILGIRLMCHLRLGHINQAVADMVKIETMQPGFAEQMFQHPELNFASSGSDWGCAKQTAQQTERLGYVQALILAFRERQQSSSKVRNADYCPFSVCPIIKCKMPAQEWCVYQSAQVLFAVFTQQVSVFFTRMLSDSISIALLV